MSNQAQAPHYECVHAYRFDIFKGAVDSDGTLRRVRLAGEARQDPGSATYVIKLHSLPRDTFYLLPERRDDTGREFSILTREPSRKRGRLYHWLPVGEAHRMPHQNDAVLALSWDLFGAGDIYMSMEAQAIYD